MFAVRTEKHSRLLALLALPILVTATSPVMAGTSTHPKGTSLPHLKACASTAKTDPLAWPRSERAAFEPLTFGFKSIEAHHATSDLGMVVGTSHPFASYAGMKVLQGCGSAMDAALTTAFTQVAQAAGAYVSYAGIAAIVSYDAKSGRTTSFSGSWATFKNDNELTSVTAPGYQPYGRTVLVPGFMPAADAAHRAGGRMPWAKLFGPALHVLERGFQVDRSFMATLASNPRVLRTAEGREVFLKPDGMPYSEGETFKQPAAARTLRGVAANGASYMQRGAWAKRFVQLVNRDGGNATPADLADYRVIQKPAASGRLRNHVVRGMAAPFDSLQNLVERLRSMEEQNLTKFGTPYESSEALYRQLQAFRSGGTSTPGVHSDAVVASDPEGNVVAVVHSFNGVNWGASGIVVDGVPLSDAATINSGAMAQAGPGRQIRTPLEPVIAFRKGRPVYASGVIGSGLIELSFVRAVDVLQYGRTAAQAAVLPSFHYQNLFSLGQYDPLVLAGVRAKGQPVVEVPDQAHATRGAWVGLTFDSSGRIVGGGTRAFGPYAAALRSR